MGLREFFSGLVYIQISPQRIVVRNAATGREFSDVPLVAIDRSGGKPRVAAVGAEAASAKGPGVEVLNPFAHPRTLVSDFTVSERLVAELLRRVRPASIIAPAPKIVMHPLGTPEGGYTQIEIRALQEMALGAGASQAVVREGRPLTDQELLAGDFGAGGRVLTA